MLCASVAVAGFSFHSNPAAATDAPSMRGVKLERRERRIGMAADLCDAYAFIHADS